MERLGTVIENGHALEQKDWSPGIEANCLVSATLAVTEKEAGVQPSLHSEVDANDLFCNSEKTKDFVIHYISLLEQKESF